MDNAISAAALNAELEGLEQRLWLLRGRAQRHVEDRSAERDRIAELERFLALAPEAQQVLEDLARTLFGAILDEIEENLTHAVREILGQDRSVTSLREIKGNRLNVHFQIEQDGKAEDILHGQGGSVCNILSVGLRLIALSRLDPAAHRPFLVLDEQDCWLKPELVPRLMKLIAQIAAKLDLQVLVITHHPVDLFAAHVERIYALSPSREHGVRVALLRDVGAGGAGASANGAAPANAARGERDEAADEAAAAGRAQDASGTDGLDGPDRPDGPDRRGGAGEDA
ncbi:MAG: hypothetical protein H0S85_17185 [Desulfovibrionaceae bacterium]|nr:hypothetical protein [Desulfovibrionaceae bacterium]